MPTLLIRMSAAGSVATKVSQPCAEPRSAITPRTIAPGTASFRAALAWSTEACVRPLITVLAPAVANPSATAKPMPAVEPVTTAVLFERSIFMGCSPHGQAEDQFLLGP